MNTKNVIAIVGATGAQGGGLARAILSDVNSPFSVRCLTRNPGSEKADALAQQGAEVVGADLDDLESLKRAFAGAYGAYCVTNYWEHFSPEKEFAQATNMAEAARDAQLKHVIWSTFEDTRDRVPLDDDRMPTLAGKYKVPHFDSKAEANHSFVERNLPVTFLLTSFYWENFIYFGLGPKPGADGVLDLTFPLGDAKLSGIAVEDIGKCAYGLFRNTDYIGKTVGIAGGHLTGEQMAAAMTAALERLVRYNAVTPAMYRGFGFPGADDMANMFQFKRDFNDEYCHARSVDESRALNPSLQDFDQWLAGNRERIPLE